VRVVCVNTREVRGHTHPRARSVRRRPPLIDCTTERSSDWQAQEACGTALEHIARQF